MGGTINFTYAEDTLWFELSFDTVDGVIVKERLQPTTLAAVIPGARISLAEANASAEHIIAPSVIITRPL